MKFLTLFLLVVATAIGCSKSKDDASPPATVTIVQDLGKDQNYYSNLYGKAISEKRADSFGFVLPAVARVINLGGPFIVQQYSSEGLGITVILRDTSTRAIWVKYTLPNHWTDEQLKAALGAYDSKWAAVTANSGVSGLGENMLKAMAPAQAPATFQSASQMLAYKTMGNELMIYSPASVRDLVQQIQNEEQKKREVPKF